MGGRPRKLPEREEVARLYQCGISTVEIARMFGTVPRSVRVQLIRAGVKLRPVGNHKQLSHCRVQGCTKPIKKIRHAGNGSIYGTMCAYHRKLHYAALNRWLTRRKKNIPPEEWMWDSEVPKELQTNQFKEKKAIWQAKQLLKEVNSELKRLSVVKSPNVAFAPGKTL